MEIKLKSYKRDTETAGFLVEDESTVTLTNSTRLGFVEVKIDNAFAVIDADELVRASMAFVNMKHV